MWASPGADHTCSQIVRSTWEYMPKIGPQQLKSFGEHGFTKPNCETPPQLGNTEWLPDSLLGYWRLQLQLTWPSQGRDSDSKVCRTRGLRGIGENGRLIVNY